MLGIVAAALIWVPAMPAVPAFAQEGPAISDAAYCASAYGALARARERRARSPRDLLGKPGYLSIDFAGRKKAVLAKHAKDELAITFHQQALEEAFDAGGYAEADGKPLPEAAGSAITLAVATARRCDQSNGFAPALLDRIVAMPAPPVEPWACAVNYMAVGMGMRDPAQQRLSMTRTQAMMARFDPTMAEDTVWRDLLRERLRADAQERNKAIGAGQVTPAQLFAHAKACDRLLPAS